MSEPGDPETTATYDRVAPRFRERNGAMVPEIEASLTAFLNAAPDGAILDAGCGTGRDMAWMEAKGAQVTGIDASRGMLSEARKIFRGPLIHMDMRSLEFRDGLFAGVWCNAALLHLRKEDAGTALREFHRVLLNWGVVAFALQVGSGEGYEDNPYGEPGARYFARYSLEEAVDLARAAGFDILDRCQSSKDVKQWIHILARKRAQQGNIGHRGET
jgi:ubiquinone/menaquinone biosynthesis C-methylase UbiE